MSNQLKKIYSAGFEPTTLFYQLVFAITIVITVIIMIFMNPNAKFRDTCSSGTRGFNPGLSRGHSGTDGNYAHLANYDKPLM